MFHSYIAWQHQKITGITICFQVLKDGTFTALKTIFAKSWNIMKSSKILIKCQLSINFLDKNRPYFISLKSSKQELFCSKKQHGIPCWRKYNLTLTFWIKRKPYFPSTKSLKQERSHNMNFSFRAKFMFL